jgi:hypothetical protein
VQQKYPYDHLCKIHSFFEGRYDTFFRQLDITSFCFCWVAWSLRVECFTPVSEACYSTKLFAIIIY